MHSLSVAIWACCWLILLFCLVMILAILIFRNFLASYGTVIEAWDLMHWNVVNKVQSYLNCGIHSTSQVYVSLLADVSVGVSVIQNDLINFQYLIVLLYFHFDDMQISFLAKMGVYLSTPKTDKLSEDGENDKLKFGLSSMQGWRASMEDAVSFPLQGYSNCLMSLNNSEQWVFFSRTLTLMRVVVY